jgi:tetratricopeptide (TPR) repeat protein
MKIRYFIAGLAAIVTSTGAYAQKGVLATAKTAYEKYETMKDQPNMETVAITSFQEAKASIDKASVHDKTATLPLTYALKGAIYANLALDDTVAATSLPLFNTANEALKKAAETDTKEENKQLIRNGNLTLAQYKLNQGVKEYQEEKYEDALKSFSYYKDVMPEDTNAVYYTALAAVQAKMYDEAVKNYSKLVTLEFSKNASIYADLSSIYMIKGDTAGAIKSIAEGTAKFPKDVTLAKREIEINLQAGKQKEVVNKIEAAIVNDPNNKLLYYYGGLTYAEMKDIKKAEEMYRKAIEIDPNYFEANLNLGFLLLNPAIEAFNAALKLPASKQKEYNEEMVKVKKMFDVAKVYVMKAVELDTQSVEALNNLKTYYLGIQDADNADDVDKRIKALEE